MRYVDVSVFLEYARSITLVQGFLPFRIYGLSKKLYISIIIWAMALMRLLGSTVLFVAGLRIPSSIQRLTAQWEWLIMVICAVGAATDVATTAALVTILVRQRSFAQKRFFIYYLCLDAVPFSSLTQNQSSGR
jgi:hypothetical protein